MWLSGACSMVNFVNTGLQMRWPREYTNCRRTLHRKNHKVSQPQVSGPMLEKIASEKHQQ